MYLSRVEVEGFRASAEARIVCSLPGRFAILIGANSAGKSTISESLYLAHPNTFPSVGRFPAAALGPGRRAIDVEYRYETDPTKEGPLGRALQLNGGPVGAGERVGAWSRDLYRQLGNVRYKKLVGSQDLADGIRMVYLPAARNPLDELARREARILIELMRAQQQRRDGTRNLADLRARASSLLEALTQDGIIAQIEARITSHLHALTAGVTRQTPHIRAQVVDDNYLARVLELMIATLEGRVHAQPLDVTGLGYVNLLHIAVTLAAIPDPAATMTLPPSQPATSVPDPTDPGSAQDAAEARRIIEQAHADAEMQEDSFFPPEEFHAVVVIEEPEAHLHPQLQFALVRYLRQVVRERPELQILITSHANDIISACEPDELVVLRRRGNQRLSIGLADLPLTEDHKRKVRLHLDASRSSALFAERLLLVEGVTEVAVIRQMAYLWAGRDSRKHSFVDALTIVAMGTKVGEWAPALLATRGMELCTKLAVLRDSDVEFHEVPTLPAWATKYDRDIVQFFQSHPTLEPAITAGNEGVVSTVIAKMQGLDQVPRLLTPEEVHALFRSAKRAKDGQPVIAGGPWQSRKAEFALELAGELMLAAETGNSDPQLYQEQRVTNRRSFRTTSLPCSTSCTPSHQPSQRSILRPIDCPLPMRASNLSKPAAMAATDPALSRLTDEQVLAAGTQLPRVYIKAYPGSGKTTVAAQRYGALRYARTSRSPGCGVVAVSFTRAATRELRHRIEASWGPTAVSGPHKVVTLDTLVYDLFRDLLKGGIVHWPGGRTDLDVIDSWAMHLEHFYTTAGVVVALNGDQVAAQRYRSERKYFPLLEHVIAGLQAGVCTHENVRDLLQQALVLPAARARMRERLTQTVSALIIDEIFDANGLDLAIVEIAAQAKVPVTLIGDPWQALYGFRGAQPDLVPALIRRTATIELPLTRSFRWDTPEQANLAAQLRDSRPVRLPKASAAETDVVLSRQWKPLWVEVEETVLPLAFKPSHGNTAYATATLLLNILTKAQFGLQATYLNEALITLGITDTEAIIRLEGPLSEVIADLVRDGPEAAREIWPRLVEAVKVESPRTIPTNSHPNYFGRLKHIATRATQARLVPGMTIHQAKGREWPTVGVHLIETDTERLEAGLTSETEHQRQLYVALTRARRRTVQV